MVSTPSSLPSPANIVPVVGAVMVTAKAQAMTAEQAQRVGILNFITPQTVTDDLRHSHHPGIAKIARLYDDEKALTKEANGYVSQVVTIERTGPLAARHRLSGRSSNTCTTRPSPG